MIDNSVDKGTLTIVVRNTGNGFDLCEMGYSLNPGEEIVDINIRIIKVKIKKWNHRHTINKFTKINSNTRKIKTIIWQSIENRN